MSSVRMNGVLRAVLLTTLIVMLVALWLPSPVLLAVAGTLVLGTLAALGTGVRGSLAAIFVVWTAGCLVTLLALADDTTSFYLMLGGLWLFPVLLWPLGFAVDFRRWLDR